MPALEGVKDQLGTKQVPLPEMLVAEPGHRPEVGVGP